jgi:uncharacterized membrane protein
MLIYFGACALLAVALAGEAAGVKAWIDIIWGYTLQPSEFVKLACIVVTAKYLENTNNPMGTPKEFIRIAALVGFPWVLTLAQGEMGSVIVMVFVFAIMMFFGGLRWQIIIGVVVVAATAIGLLIGYTISSGSDSYRLMRILSFFNPAVDENASYQVTQSKIAIGSGGWNGVGTFVQGSFSQLDYVPEDWTDFIFSTIGEAFGFVGCTLVVLTYLAIILRMLYLAMYTHNRFGQHCIISIMAMMFFHVLENGSSVTMAPTFGSFVLCGVLWGLSLIVPGMSSSTILIILGLFEPLTAGIGSLDFKVLLPFVIGIAGTTLLLARVVNMLYTKHYPIMSKVILGFVIASSLKILPSSFGGIGTLIISMICFAGGFAVARYMDCAKDK